MQEQMVGQKPAPSTQVEKQMEMLLSEADSLGKAVEELEMKLGKVLLDGGPAPNITDTVQPEQLVPFAMEIRAVRRHIEDIGSGVRSILSRLEL